MSRARDTADQINRVNSSAADATAITVDSSENVLVGKTTTAVNTQGIQLGSNGRFYATSDGAESAVFNRKTSDGTIADFRKDNTSVGSIGVSGTRMHLLNGDTGLRFAGDTNSIFPCTTAGADSNNAIDLGASGNRFKDFYVGGGIYLGGVGSANKLEDYEEGTFNVVYNQGASGGTYSRQFGQYTKVGRVVHFEIDFHAQGWSSNASSIQIGGLPFVAQNTLGLYGGATINYQAGYLSASETGEISFHVSSNTSRVSMYYANGNSVTGNSVNNINGRIIISGRYFTAA